MQLSTRNLSLITEDGRTLVRGLNLQLGAQKVALIGHNGVGKSTLFRTLAGARPPDEGHVLRQGTIAWVPQRLQGEASGGELRRQALEQAFASDPDFLLLDEPGNDLDPRSHTWLLERLERYRRGLMVVSHDPRVLDRFQDFFSIEEAGCRLLHGAWATVQERLEAEARHHEEVYAAGLLHHARRASHHRRSQRRRARKRNVGRLHELDRNQSRARLNTRRGLAQVSQAKVAARQQDRLEQDRRWAEAHRRALRVTLPLELAVPERHGEFERIGVIGPNGCGKSTLLRSLVPPGAEASADVGWIDQGAERWRLPTPLTSLLEQEVGIDRASTLLVAHRFPLGLARRPLARLSPGERTRAALIALFTRSRLQTLVLDEPTWSLDPVGRDALERALMTWRGGLIIAGHDRSFLAPLVDSWVRPGRADPQGARSNGERGPSLRGPWLRGGEER